MGHTMLRWIVVGLVISACGCQRNKVRVEMENAARPLESVSASSPRLGLWVPNTLLALTVAGEGSQSQVQFQISEDGGDTFEKPVPVSEPGANVRAGGENSPALFTDIQGDIFAAWFQDSATHGPQLMVSGTKDFGQSFQKPVNVIDADRKSDAYAGFPAIAASPKGDVYVAWLDERDHSQPEGSSSVYFVRSTDHGATFGRDVKIASAACPCCRPQLYVASNGEIYLGWRKVFAGDVRDMVLARSVDGGKTFSAPVRLAVDDWVLHACPDTGPSIAARNGRVYVAWYSEGHGTAGIRLAISADDGTSFDPEQIVSGDVTDANHPRLSVAEDGRTLLVFQGRSQESGKWRVNQAYLVEINGNKATAPVRVTNSEHSVSHPDLIAGTAGRVFLAWTESANDQRQALLSRGWLR
jgi:BNR repeat-like domain